MQPFTIPGYFVVAPQRSSFSLAAGASLDLMSSLNVSGFDVYLKADSSMRCNGYVSIDGNSTLHMERGSHLLSYEFHSKNVSATIAVNDLNIVNGMNSFSSVNLILLHYHFIQWQHLKNDIYMTGVLKFKTDGIGSKFQIFASVFNILQQGAFHGNSIRYLT